MIRVLIVEDEINTLNLLKIIVNWEELHMKIVGTASNGKEALFLIPDVHPDLLITDIKMPIMDGIELSREVNKKYSQIKVMIVTAYDDITLAQQALRAGVADYILKPLKRQEVKEALARINNQFEKEAEDRPYDLIEKVCDFLNEHYMQSDLSLSSVAEKFYVNPSYLSRAFHKKMGIGLVEYLNNIRLDHACDYLLEGNWKIYEVAEKVGIPNPDYFTKCFRKKMGISVKNFREGKNSTEKSKNNLFI